MRRSLIALAVQRYENRNAAQDDEENDTSQIPEMVLIWIKEAEYLHCPGNALVSTMNKNSGFELAGRVARRRT